jgi:hypothetical protein
MALDPEIIYRVKSNIEQFHPVGEKRLGKESQIMKILRRVETYLDIMYQQFNRRRGQAGLMLTGSGARDFKVLVQLLSRELGSLRGARVYGYVDKALLDIYADLHNITEELKKMRF